MHYKNVHFREKKEINSFLVSVQSFQMYSTLHPIQYPTEDKKMGAKSMEIMLLTAMLRVTYMLFT